MNLYINSYVVYESIRSERIRAAVRGSASGASGRVRVVRAACVTVRTVVCAQCARQCAAVFLEVYGSAHSSVQLFNSAAVCGSVRQYATVCGSAAVVCCSVWQCVCGSAAVCDSAAVAGSS
jgi:hypothetical protein